MEEELRFLVRCLLKWRRGGIAFRDIVILTCPGNWYGERVQSCLDAEGIPSILVTSREAKESFLGSEGKISLMNIQSSKGLEFQNVVMAGLGHIRIAQDELAEKIRLLYVGMTRARENLLLTASAKNKITDHIENINETLRARTLNTSTHNSPS
jgi:superfamily I DNA/RNA helicase